MPGVLTNLGPVATGTTLAGNVGGVVSLPGKGHLYGVSVYPATSPNGPIYVSVALFNFTQPNLGTAGVVLVPSAWVRTVLAGGSDPANWTGIVNLEDPAGWHLEVTVRNDTGSSVSMTVAAVVGP